jgi:hypothetical protein
MTYTDKIMEAIMGTKEWFARSKERFEKSQEYKRTHSACCDGLLVNDICSDCKEHASDQTHEN